MSGHLSEFEHIILFGGGCLAERLYHTDSVIREKLVAVIDSVPEDKRKIDRFHGIKIVDPGSIPDPFLHEAAVVIAIGSINVCNCVKQLVEQYDLCSDNIFVVNPYSSLRFFMVNDELASDKRIPFSDERYDRVRSLLRDPESLDVFERSINSKPFESNDDVYELVSVSSLGDKFFYAEDYWNSHSFTDSMTDKATVLDCGAYIGDSIMGICRSIPEKEVYYYAFEPLKSSLDQITANKEYMDYCKELIPMAYGVGEFDEVKLFGVENSASFDGARFISEDSISSYSDTWKLDIRAIDYLDIDINGTLYIKMDIEGSELAALKGARVTIQEHHPYLAVCLYHRKNDLVDIPLYIDSLGVKYKYYLRGGYHTILWAIPQ
ncbi:methyltransferase, FkbM family [Ruminococcaceae bacterium KH2T8]|nr:methyltransferase, FkbM family [Ruminococcaceae bacterium KH2T8]